jgi:hypothetical protein
MPICSRLRRDDALPFWFEVMRQNREHEESGEAGSQGRSKYEVGRTALFPESLQKKLC